jgi:hypothetical protein
MYQIEINRSAETYAIYLGDHKITDCTDWKTANKLRRLWEANTTYSCLATSNLLKTKRCSYPVHVLDVSLDTLTC